MTSLNPTGRFSSRVDDYVPDIGSGTGFLTKLFLGRGCTVRGIEPNAEMRRAGDAFLSGYANFGSLDGTAEQTGLPDAGIDLVAAGQA